MQIIAHKKIPLTFSAVLVLASLVCIGLFGFKLGLDFTGGSVTEVSYSQNLPTTAQIQTAISPLGFGEAVVQSVGDSGALIRSRTLSEPEHQQLLVKLNSLAVNGASMTEKRFESIGPAVSSQLRSRSLGAIVLVNIAILLYIAYAFRKVSRPVASWKFGVAAIISLMHDVVITMGVFSLLGHFYGIEVNIPFVVALLTILGYSVNDTIVVFDRIRENLLRRVSPSFSETVNIAVNQTIARSVNTSLTVLLVLAALFVFGGASIHYFAGALLIGIFFGTYSSIFLASPILVLWNESK